MSAATVKCGATLPGALSYRFQLFNTAGTMVPDSGPVGPVSWSSDGVKLETTGSYVRYAIPQTVQSGECAMESKGLRTNAPGDASSPPNSITYRVLFGAATATSVRYEPTTEQRLISVKHLDPNTW